MARLVMTAPGVAHFTSFPKVDRCGGFSCVDGSCNELVL